MDGEVAATGVMQEASAAGLGSSLARGMTEAAAEELPRDEAAGMDGTGHGASRRGWTASRAAEGGGDEGKGRGGEDGAGPDRGGGRRGRGARHEGAAAAAVGGEVEEGHVAAGVEDAGRRRARRARRKTGRGGGVSLVRRDEEEKRRGIEGER